MAGQDSEKETWSDESLDSARDPEASGCSEKSTDTSNTPNTIRKASSTAIRSVQQGLGKVATVSVRLYKHSWPKVSPVLVRVYQRKWPKVSSAAVRLYQHDLPAVKSTVRSLCSNLLEVVSIMLRCLQLASALYVFISVTENFRFKRTVDRRVRQIQPMMLTSLIYSALAIVCFLSLSVIKKLRVSCWHVVAISSIPADVTMICLFVAKIVIFGVHSFECAAISDNGKTWSTFVPHHEVQKAESLELRSWLNDNLNAQNPYIALPTTRSLCLLPSSVYFFCIIAALSYIGSVSVTILQLLVYRKTGSTMGRGQYPGHIEQVLPGPRSWPPQMTSQRRTSLDRRLSSWGLPTGIVTLPRPTASSQDPKYANMPAGILESMAIAAPRTSFETTSSMDPDHYIVSDGFRPVERRPPSYASRESSRGPPEYRSRPPSLHAVILVGPATEDPELA